MPAESIEPFLWHPFHGGNLLPGHASGYTTQQPLTLASGEFEPQWLRVDAESEMAPHNRGCATGPLLNYFGPLLNYLGPRLNYLGPHLNYLGPLLNYLGPPLEYLGPLLNYLGPHLNYLGPHLNYIV